MALDAAPTRFLSLLPGIIAEEVVEPLPPVLKALCKRLVRWRILPHDREPDSAIVNVYDKGAPAERKHAPSPPLSFRPVLHAEPCADDTACDFLL